MELTFSQGDHLPRRALPDGLVQQGLAQRALSLFKRKGNNTPTPRRSAEGSIGFASEDGNQGFVDITGEPIVVPPIFTQY